MKNGSVVLATAGKEKNEIFVVVKIDKNFVYLADGKRLSAFKPKKKSVKHVKLLDENGLNESDILDQNERINAKIRKYLKNLKNEKEWICQRKM